MIRNTHQRLLPCTPEEAAHLIDNLSGPEEALWPVAGWPRMRLSDGLNPGSYGGHGPIGYFVEAYRPGRTVHFRFTDPCGFKGYHRLEVREHEHGCMLEHDLQVSTSWMAWLKWHLIFRPLHDALLEDALDRAATRFGGLATSQHTLYVRLLRWFLRKR